MVQQQEEIQLEQLKLERDGSIARVTINRPEVRNAFGDRLIEELGAAFATLDEEPDVRVIALSGEGASFSAGADVNWMRASIDYSRQQNVEDATRLALMLDAIKSCEKPVVCRVQGAAFGGALGLISAADYAVAATDAVFSFSEVKLGLIPAVISPFVLRRIGPGQARALFVTGERFDAERALRIGLVHTVVPPEELDDEVDRVVGELLTAAPVAITVAKRLVGDVAYRAPKEMIKHTAETIATKRTDSEGQEGLMAFLDKRKPTWMDDDHQPSWIRG